MIEESELLDIIVKALEPYDIPTGSGWSASERVEPAKAVLAALTKRGLVNFHA